MLGFLVCLLGLFGFVLFSCFLFVIIILVGLIVCLLLSSVLQGFFLTGISRVEPSTQESFDQCFLFSVSLGKNGFGDMRSQF